MCIIHYITCNVYYIVHINSLHVSVSLLISFLFVYSYSNYYRSSNYLNETPTVHGLAANKMNDLAQEQNAAIYFIIIGLT